MISRQNVEFYTCKASFIVFTDLLSVNLDPGRKLKITDSDPDLTHKVVADPDRTKFSYPSLQQVIFFCRTGYILIVAVCVSDIPYMF